MKRKMEKNKKTKQKYNKEEKVKKKRKKKTGNHQKRARNPIAQACIQGNRFGVTCTNILYYYYSKKKRGEKSTHAHAITSVTTGQGLFRWRHLW